MQYRMFVGQLTELKSRLLDAELAHYQLSLDLRIVESLGDDAKILAAEAKLEQIAKTIQTLSTLLDAQQER
jgi:hypothetical protein